MPIAEIPKQVPTGAEQGRQSLKERTDGRNSRDRRWMRKLGTASLFTGAFLLASGRRRAGLTAATVGTALVILEEPENLAATWAVLPSYIRAGERFLGRLQGVVEQIAEQQRKLRDLADRFQR